MSVLPHMVDPRSLLPQTAGPSLYAPDTLFWPCPANAMPWGRLHVRPVYLPVKPCKPPKNRPKKSAYYESFYCICSACNFRAFFAGPFWANGVTRDQILQQHGHGVAVDDRNCYF